MAQRTGIKPNISIRLDPEVYYQAKVQAAIARQSIGAWIEEAILEKVERERPVITK